MNGVFAPLIHDKTKKKNKKKEEDIRNMRIETEVKRQLGTGMSKSVYL